IPDSDEEPTTPWRASAELAVRRLAAITIAGAALGVLVGGVGGRLAMLLLAARNPRATGVASDDGFTMGQFTIGGTAQLLGTAWQVGLLGAFAYALVRSLLIGPTWFRVVSVSLGSGVVVAALIVHTDGVDFTLLQPTALTVGLFVAIPVVYAALLTLVTERWIAAGGWPAQGRLRAVLATLLLWVPLLPLLPVLVGGWAVAEWVRRRSGRPRLCGPVLSWWARAALAMVFLVAVDDLVSDIRLLS
ncbi:MAG TPA: hypothetical protein VNA12_01925, partial [Mycobacteriales bacterium]|nr:hypothetical protein [Mycobacteriales bacterium]